MSTSYYKNTSKKPTVNDIPISVSSNEFVGTGLEDKDYFWNLCQRKLNILNQKAGEYFCTKCNVSYYPEHAEVRGKSKLVTPSGYNSNDRDVGVAYTPEPITGKQPPN